MYWVFATLYTFFTIIIAQLIIEQNLRIIFYLAMILLFASLNNVYYSIKYYINLRNHKGIKGDRGDPGEPGQDGSNGVCVKSKTCGIVNCRKMIMNSLEKLDEDYKKINENIKDNLELSVSQKDKKAVMDKYINILLPQCESFEEGVDTFKNIIEATIKKN